jgi:hypothetical protein
MDRGVGGAALADCGELGPPPRAVPDPRRLLFSPVRGAWAASSSPSSSSSLVTVGAPMDSPPGMLFAPGPGMLIGPEVRPMGVPTGMDEGREP